MLICFELSMPGCPSWNGKWSGDNKLYAKIVHVKKKESAEAILSHKYYSYSWPDGWCAGISVREVSVSEARSIRKHSKGFCGYDWMVNNILSHGSPADPATGEQGEGR